MTYGKVIGFFITEREPYSVGGYSQLAEPRGLQSRKD